MLPGCLPVSFCLQCMGGFVSRWDSSEASLKFRLTRQSQSPIETHHVAHFVVTRLTPSGPGCGLLRTVAGLCAEERPAIGMNDGEQTYEQEVQLGALFQSIGSAFKRLEKAAGKADTVQDELKGISANLQEGRACVASADGASWLHGVSRRVELDYKVRRLIKDFEREARIDGMAPSVLAARKRDYVQALNRFIEMKKPYLTGGAAKARRPGEAASPTAPLSRSEQYEGEVNPSVCGRCSSCLGNR